MTEEGAEGLLCTYASLDSVEVDPPRDLMASWEGPESFFLVQGASPRTYWYTSQGICLASSQQHSWPLANTMDLLLPEKVVMLCGVCAWRVRVWCASYAGLTVRAW